MTDNLATENTLALEIREALAGSLPSGDLLTLMDRTKAAHLSACERVREIDGQTNDPATDEAETDSLILARSRAEVEAGRLKTATERLAELLIKTQRSEQEAAHAAFYAEVRTKTDALKTRVEREYPKAASAISALIQALAENAAEVQKANANRSDKPWLLNAEEMARSLPNAPDSRLKTNVQLPPLDARDPRKGYWPPYHLVFMAGSAHGNAAE